MALAKGRDPLRLEDGDLRRYLATLRRRKYAESTIQRRGIVWIRILNHEYVAKKSLNGHT